MLLSRAQVAGVHSSGMRRCGRASASPPQLWSAARPCSSALRQQAAVVAAQSSAGSVAAAGAANSQVTKQAAGNISAAIAKQVEYVEVGLVAGTFGVRGEVRVKVLTDDPAERMKQGARLFLQAPALKGVMAGRQAEPEPLREVLITGTKIRVLAKGVEARILQFEEIKSPEEADSVRGYTLVVPVSQRVAPQDPDEFYLQDLIGCKVFHQVTMRRIGQVVDVFGGTGSHDTLTVQLRPNAEDIKESQIRTSLMPFVKAMCPVVDVAGKRMEVDPPEGLFDINTVRKTRKPLTPEQKALKLKQLADELREEDLYQPPPRAALPAATPSRPAQTPRGSDARPVAGASTSKSRRQERRAALETAAPQAGPLAGQEAVKPARPQRPLSAAPAGAADPAASMGSPSAAEAAEEVVESRPSAADAEEAEGRRAVRPAMLARLNRLRSGGAPGLRGSALLRKRGPGVRAAAEEPEDDE